jgi:hypothetical protein
MNILKILEECKDMVLCWSDYANDYFRKKHGLDDDLEQLDKWIEEAGNQSNDINGELLTAINYLNELLKHKDAEIVRLQSQIIGESVKMKLYYHKTSGGAEYLCSQKVGNTMEGDLKSTYIVRIDRNIKNDAELVIRGKND